ncbi:hypothetical protein [uncultured Microbacterium sp.]|uniref:hypothetical protein n=1 Tax=uncultured Microbacterium sp. TaxID=191216 RepID=UPI0026329FEA|nr:hypothetical protein [uncultured Microbacterium sp.]
MPEQAETLDDIARALVQHRAHSGLVSYAEIASRISAYRQENGTAAHQASVAKTTVYDAFRIGRARIDPDLIADIVRALGADEETTRLWRTRAANAQRTAPTAAPTASETAAVPTAPVTAPAAKPKPTAPPAFIAPALSFRQLLLPAATLMTAAIMINVIGAGAVTFLSLPLYLDMIGTAWAAIALGPWYGAIVGVFSTAASVGVNSHDAIPFVLVNVAGALVWGYGARSFGMARSLRRYLSLNVIVAIVCSLVALPLILLLFSGMTGHEADSVTDALRAIGAPLPLAVFVSDLLTSLTDKLFSGFLALGLLISSASWVPQPPTPTIWSVRD